MMEVVQQVDKQSANVIAVQLFSRMQYYKYTAAEFTVELMFVR